MLVLELIIQILTNASRAIKPKEKALCEKNGVSEIIEIVVGNDGISFAHAVSAPDAILQKSNYGEL